MGMARWHARHAWVGEVCDDVLIEVEGDRISGVVPGVAPPPDAIKLHGFTIPGLANSHSHAFHRALRGRTHRRTGDFWSWRAQMYDLAGRLEPAGYHALARATYAEMALAGITAVGEFHYLHHAPNGAPYDDPNEMSEALTAAAREAGIRITLLDTCYLQAGMRGEELEGPQVRFGDGDVQTWMARVDSMKAGESVRTGAAIHSVRAVDAPSMKAVAGWASEREVPLHFHVSEQPAENQQSIEVTGRTPVELFEEAGALGDGATAVHATHLSDPDVKRLGETATRVCMCPTTERDLADGIGPARALADAGSPLCVGTDSHAVIDIFEEPRGVELDERLARLERNVFEPEVLFSAASEQGMRSLGWDAGRIEAGMLADFVTLNLDSVRLAGAEPDGLLEMTVFAATAADVSGVVVAGRTVVEEGRHVALPNVALELDRAIQALYR